MSQTTGDIPLDPTAFSGVLSITKNPDTPDDLEEMAVTDDLDAEGETVPDYSHQNLVDGNLAADHEEDLLKTVHDVSRGVSDNTHDEYLRYVPYLSAGHSHC